MKRDEPPLRLWFLYQRQAVELLQSWRWPDFRLNAGWVSISQLDAHRCWWNCYDLLRTEDAPIWRQLQYQKLMFCIDIAHALGYSKNVTKAPPPKVWQWWQYDPFAGVESEDFA